MSNAISIKGFSKSFGGTKVIHDLDFEVKEGEIFAFLGANGSGKTTTIRCLLHIYKADAGELLVYGEDYSHNQAHLLGYLPEERGLYTSSKALETLVYFAQIKGLPKQDATSKAKAFLERVELADKADVEIKKLSSGQQQKIQLGVTIINRPKLLILDEPTKGLDPVNRSLLMDILKELNAEGSTIVFSTHQMDEAEKVADRLLMIKDGHRKLYGEVNEVRESFGSNTIHLKFIGKLQGESTKYVVKVDTNHAEITPKQGVSANEVLADLMKQNIKISSFNVQAPSLQEIFIKVSKQDD